VPNDLNGSYCFVFAAEETRKFLRFKNELILKKKNTIPFTFLKWNFLIQMSTTDKLRTYKETAVSRRGGDNANNNMILLKTL
jgi:hypothetical protein